MNPEAPNRGLSLRLLPEVPGQDGDGGRKQCPALISHSLPLSQALFNVCYVYALGILKGETEKRQAGWRGCFLVPGSLFTLPHLASLPLTGEPSTPCKETLAI